MTLQYRPLTKAEALTVPKMSDPMPDSMVVIGAVDEKGEVVAACGVYFVVHADPIWIREDYRRKGEAKRLWAATYNAVRETRMGADIVVMLTEDWPEPPIQEIAERMVGWAGGSQWQGRVFVIPVR